jgi:hypothetical protein
MSLATLTTLINNNIRNKNPKVIKTEHADVEQAIVDEFFPSVDNIVGEINGVTYNLNLLKQGRIVVLNAEIENTNAVLVNSININLPSKYSSLFLSNQVFLFLEGLNVGLYVDGQDLFTSILPPQEIVNFSLTYISNND